MSATISGAKTMSELKKALTELDLAKAFNADLEEENERLRVELAAANSKIEQLRGGKGKKEDTRKTEWSIDYGTEMVIPSFVAKMLLEERHRGEDLKLQKLRAKWEEYSRAERALPLSFSVQRNHDYGSIVVRMRRDGQEISYYTMEGRMWDDVCRDPDRRAGYIREVTVLLYRTAYQAQPPPEVLETLAVMLAKTLREAGVLKYG
jgi:hypothetical protein